jgi:hypothetical protein
VAPGDRVWRRRRQPVERRRDCPERVGSTRAGSVPEWIQASEVLSDIGHGAQAFFGATQDSRNLHLRYADPLRDLSLYESVADVQG